MKVMRNKLEIMSRKRMRMRMRTLTRTRERIRMTTSMTIRMRMTKKMTRWTRRRATPLTTNRMMNLWKRQRSLLVMKFLMVMVIVMTDRLIHHT
jgi:hypothetical protein